MKQNLLFNQLTAMPKRLAMVLTVLFTIGVGSMWGAEVTVSLSDGEHDGTNITWMAADGNITITQSKGTSTTAVNSSYISVPRVYKGHILSFEAKDGYKIKQIDLKCNSTYYGNSMTAGTVVTNNNVTNNTSEVSRTWTTTSGGTHVVSSVSSDGLSAIYIQNVASASNVQLRLTSIVITYVEESSIPANPYTVTLKDDNSTLPQSTAGAAITLPSRDGCYGYTFAGWTNSWKAHQTSWTTTAPTIIPAGSYTPTEDENLYPVYTKTEGGGTAYEKVTTLTEGVYVMVSEKTSGTYKYMPNTTSSSSNPTLGSGITMNNGKTSLTNDITEAMLWDLTATGTANQYYLRPHGSTTIGLGCTASTGANIRISGSYKDVKWTITTSTNYGWQFKSNASTPMYLAVYNDDYWRNYKDATTNQNGKFYLFKQTSSSITSYISVPDCTTKATVDLYHNDGTISGGGWILSGNKYTQTLETTSDVTLPTPTKDGYEFGGWYENSGFTGSAVTAVPEGTEGGKTYYAKWNCIAPTSVTVTPTNENGWRYSIGETISLEATATGGSADAYSYQWQKYIGDTWTDIAGATSQTFTKANCTSGDGGSYRCVVSTGNDCSSKESEGYFVRVFTLNGNYYGEDWTENAIIWSSENEGTATIHLEASRTYLFKVTDNDGKWFGYGDATNYIVQPWQADCGTSTGNGENADIRLFTGPEGDYTFTINIEHAQDGDPYVNIAVAYPEVEHPVVGYGYIPKWWENCYIHWWDNSDQALTVWGSDAQIKTYTTICESDYYYFPILDNYTNLIIKDAAGDAGNSTGNQTQNNHSGWYISHNGTSWNWYEFAEYTITFDANGGTGTMTSIEEICPNGERVLTNNTYSKTGYTFAGWKANVALKVNGSTVAAGTLIADGATIQNISSNITLTAQWTPKQITITWNANGGSVDPTTSTYTYDGAVVELPTPTRASYIFDGWFTAASSGTKITEVGTTNKPAEDVIYYAQWTEKATPTFAWSADSYTAALEADNTFPTLNNLNGLSVTYESLDTDVATIDAYGNITLVATGTTTITATGAESATHKLATANYTLNVAAANCKWVETDIADINSGDEVVVTMTKSGYTYAMSNNRGTTIAPDAIVITVKDGIINEVVETYNQWTIIKDNNYLVFYADASNRLYGNKADDGLRVGSANNALTNHEFFISNNYLVNKETSRYVGVNLTKKEWYCYQTNTGNIKDQTLKFYKKVCLDSEHYWVTWDANGGQWSDGSTKKEEIYTVGATITKPADPTREGYRFDGWTPTPGKMPDENTTFKAQWAELYTVNFYSNGIEVCSFEEIAGQTVNCTNTPTTCDDEYPHFIGWTDTEIDGVATDKPALVTLPLTVSESQDYHAVFAKGTLATGGDAETVTFANSGYSNQQTISTVTLTNATITFAKGSNNNNAPKYYTTGAAIRCYGGNTFTVTSNNEITKISLTFASGEGSNEITASLGTYSNGIWTGSTKSVTFTIGGSSGHRRIASVSVTAGSPENLTEFITSCCTPWAAPTLSANTSIAVGGTTTITYSGTTYGDVTYTSSNADVATVDADGKVTGVKPGKTTITASWDGVDGSGNYCPAEATIDVTVTGSFIITYDANHASATGATTATTIAYPTGQGTVATNGFALAEHQFVKWNTSSDGSGTSYSEGASITLTDDITLYAIWQRYCTITYVIPAGGGALAAGATTTVVAGGAVQMPGIENNSIDLEYSCEELIGWTTLSTYENANGQKPNPFYAIGSNLSGIIQNTTLYAVYSRAGNGVGGTVTLTAQEMEGWSVQQSYGTLRELVTCHGTWKTTGVKSTGNPIQLRATDNTYVEFPELQGNITQVVLNATNGSNVTLTSGTFTLKTLDGQTTIASASVNNSGVCTLTVTGSYKTARLYSSVTARIANISISYGPAAIVSTNLKCTNDFDECTITYDLNESLLPTGTTVYGACADVTFSFSEIGTYTICATPIANEHQLLGWNNQCDGKGSINYTPGQVISSLPQNNIVLYAQWAPQVIVHDSYKETFVYPTEARGSITLNPGTQGCDPKKYDFIGWTDVNPLIGNSTESPWNQTNTPPTLLPTNLDGTVTYTPDGPSEVYAVYALEDEANSDAFIISATVSGTVYYAKSHTNYYLRATTDKSEAVKLYKERMASGTNTYFMYYVDDNGEKQYLYSNSGDLNTSTNPGATYGWQFIQSGSGYKFKSTNGDEKCLSTNGNSFTLVNESNLSVLFTMETVAEYQYVAKTNCTDEVTITFVPGNGIMTPSNTTVTAKPSDVITLPTCEFSGWTFLGWVTDNVEETERPNVMTIYTDAFEVGNSDITLYAYYTCDPEPVPFDGNTDGVWKIYSEVTSGTYKYANSHTSNNPATLPASDYCPNAEDWTFVNAGEPYKYYIKNEAGKYLTPESNTKTGFTFGSTPQIWNIESAGNDQYKIYHNETPDRLIMCGPTAFYNTSNDNINNPAWHLVFIGGCINSVYTTDPQEREAISVTGTLQITSAVGQTVKAADKITLTIKNMPSAQVFNISADNLTFYDEENKVITSLQAGNNGSLTAVLSVAYTPIVANKLETPQIKIEYGGKIRSFRNVSARSLPATFAIVAKVGNLWYALPSQGLNSTTPPTAYPVEVDDMADPTAVTAVPENADWSLRQVYASSGSNDRFTANGDNLVFVNNASPAMVLNASSSEKENYLLTDAQYANYYQTNPGLYEWTPTTTDLETYQLTNEQRGRTLSVNTATVFGVHAQDKAVEQVRFLPITGRYTPAALQVVEWKENSVVIMYNGDPAQTASVSVNGGAVQTTELSGDGVQKDIAVYELTADGLATNPSQRLSITIGTETTILSIPYIISGSKNDIDVLPGSTVAARQEVAKVSDLVILKDATLTAAGAKGNPYKFRNVTIYGGGKLVIPSEKGFGVASLTLRAGGITDAGEYDYVYPQFELRGTFTNTAGKFYYDYITDYDHWYHLVLPFAGELGSITYPTEFYGTNVTANNTGSWVIKRYAGEIRATGNYNAWVDIESEDATTTTAGKGYIFWGAPKKVSVSGGTKVRQKWGIQRITMPITAGNAIDAENDKEGGKTISRLSSYANVDGNSGKDNDQGWNLIGNPYMVNLTDMSTSGLHACKLVEVIDPATGKWNGQWEWNDETNIRYLTIPSDHFDTYTAKTVIQAVPLVPGRAFFVQLEGEANGVTFAAANRASLMPQHLAAQNREVAVETGIILSNETMQDEMNFWIKDGKTNDYEYNADYPKTPNSTNFNIYGVHINGNLSWVATGPEYAEESMPIGYQVPAAGTYTLSISETYFSDLLDALFVTDHAMSPEVTVDLMSAPYEFSVNQAETNNERFTVSVRLKSENQGPTTGVDNTGPQRDGTIKFIYQDKIFILHHGKIYDATGKQITTINK